MLLQKEKKFIKELEIKIEKEKVVENLLNYEKKYSKNSFDVLFEEEKYMFDAEFNKWICETKKFLEYGGDATKINKINNQEKIGILSTGPKMLDKFLRLKKKIVFIEQDNTSISKIIALCEMSSNYVYIFGKTKKKYKSFFTKSIICSNPREEIQKISDFII